MPAKPSKEQLEELLSAYIDGECSNADRARLERAMAADPDLRSRLDQLRQTVRLVQSIEGEPAPEHLRQRILAQLERRSLLGDLPGRAVAPTPSRLLPRAGLAAAIFVLAVGAGWWIYRASTGRLRSMPGPSRQFAAVKPAEPETTSMPPFQEAGQLAAAKPGQPGPTRGAEPVAAPGPAPKTDQQKPLPPVDALAMARGAKREARDITAAERADRRGRAALTKKRTFIQANGVLQTRPIVSRFDANGTVDRFAFGDAFRAKAPTPALVEGYKAALPVPGVLEIRVLLEDARRLKTTVEAVSSAVEQLGGRVNGWWADAESHRLVATVPRSRATKLIPAVESLPFVVRAETLQRGVAEPISQMVAVAMAQQWLGQARDAMALLVRPIREEAPKELSGLIADATAAKSARAESSTIGRPVSPKAARREMKMAQRGRRAVLQDKKSHGGAPAGLSAGMTRARVLTRGSVLAGVPVLRSGTHAGQALTDTAVVVVIQSAPATQPSK